jgi:DNA primase
VAGRIPQSFINDLLARADIVHLIDSRVKLKRAGKDYSGLCPFHDEKTPSFTVVPEKQFYHCFGCGANGTALTFLMEYDNLDFVSAVEALAADVGVEVPRERGGGRDRRIDADLYEVLERAERFFRDTLKHPDGETAVAYLKTRGLTGITARDFGIGYAPASWDGLKAHLKTVKEPRLVEAGLLIEGKGGRTYDRFRDRIMFPIRDTRGRVIGFGGRVLDDGQPKYLNSPETPVFHKGHELYGLYEARRAVRRLERVIVVEGYMDVVALAEAGFPNAVASLGTATSNAQFEKLFRLVPEVVCCFDGDRAGREAAWKALVVALPTLKGGRQLRFVFLPDGDDPDSLVRSEGQQGFEARLQGAVSAGEYLFQRLSQGMDLGTMDARARLVELALPHINTVPDGALRELMLARLAEVSRLPREALIRGDDGGRPASSGPRQGMTREASRLSKRLLSILLQHPEFAPSVDAARREQLLALDDSAVATTLRFLDAHPDADTTALLGYWAGREQSDAIGSLADTPLILDPDALEQEFSDAVDQYLAAVLRADRRALVRDLGEGGSSEDLAKYWQLKQSNH